MVDDERKSAYQRYLLETNGFRPVSTPAKSLAQAEKEPVNEQQLLVKAAAIRNARSFHRLPPETRGLPSTLADASIVFEVLGDADDSVRMNIANALSVTQSCTLVERAIPILPALDEWLSSCSSSAATEVFATAAATRLGLEHLAMRNALLDADDGPSLAGVVTWASDARAIADSLQPCSDDFEAMIGDVFDAATVNSLLLFKAQRAAGHAKLASDTIPPDLVPLLRYAELLDVGNDIVRHIRAANLLTPRSAERLLRLAEPLLPSIADWLCGFARRRRPLSRSAAAFFALANVVNHLRAPIHARLFVDG
jgi:hypothetical protein